MASDDPKPTSAPPLVATPRYSVETTWIRAYARTYIPNETPFSFPPALLRAAGVTLVDVRNICRRGRVIYADKLEEPGALWVVEGEDMQGRVVRLEIIVVSEEISVSLRDLEIVVKEECNDAA